MEKSSATRGFPIAKAAYAFLKDNISSTAFTFPGWNKGRIICQRSQLKRLSPTSSEQSRGGFMRSQLVSITDLVFPKAGTRIYTSDLENESVAMEKITSSREELMATVPLWI